MDNGCACRTDRAAHQSEFTHEPKSLSPSLNLFQLTSVHTAPASEPCAAVRLHVPDGCNNHPPDEKHVASLVLGYLTVGDHAIENNFWIIDAICYLPHDLPSRRLFRG
jgi:hypothetical protein